MIVGLPWWLFALCVLGGTLLGNAIACALAVAWGVALGLVDLWRDRPAPHYRRRNRW